jgi:hypothetical protein
MIVELFLTQAANVLDAVTQCADFSMSEFCGLELPYLPEPSERQEASDVPD